MNTPNAQSVMCAWERIDPKWSWHHAALLRLRQNLLHAQTQPTASVDAPQHPPSAGQGAATEENLEHDVVLAEVLSEAERLPEIDAALQRLREGHYGTCEESGEPIPAARLRALPWTRFARAPAERRFRPVPRELASR